MRILYIIEMLLLIAGVISGATETRPDLMLVSAASIVVVTCLYADTRNK